MGRGREVGREGGRKYNVPVSCEYNTPSLSSDSSENIPQIATSSRVHTGSWLILRGHYKRLISVHTSLQMNILHTNLPGIEWEDLQSRQWQC